MRKYSISKMAYIVLIAILACMSIGYTYAYFSAQVSAQSNLKLGKIDIVWRDKNSRAYITETLFPNDPETDNDETLAIPLSGSLGRGEYVAIQSGSTSLKLEVYNRNNEALTIVGACCRIQIIASYIPAGGTEADRVYCDAEDEWFQLAIKTGVDANEQNTYDLITEKEVNGWFFKDGYYYLGTKEYDYDNEKWIYTLDNIEAGGGREVADYIYMSPDADAKILGGMVNIVVSLQALQWANGAYEEEWGLK